MRTLTLALFAMLGVSAVMAQPPGGAGGGMPDNATIMQRNDANKDGEITQAEAQAAGTQLGQTFATFDLNSDGKVVAEELDTMRQRMAAGGGFGGGPGGPGAGAAPAAAAPPAAAGDSEEEEEE